MTWDLSYIALRCVQGAAASIALAALLVLVSAAVLTSLWLRHVLPAPLKVVPWNVLPFSFDKSLQSGVQHLVSCRAPLDSSIPLLTVEGAVRGFFGKQSHHHSRMPVAHPCTPDVHMGD